MASSNLTSVMAVASSGLQAQSTRMKVIAENIAGAATTPSKPGETPYQRQVVTFKNEFDRALGVSTVKVDGVVKDRSEFVKQFDPSHVKPIIESMDMKEAQRAYEANLTVIEASRSMLLNTISLLRK